jgi:hypothetical protein
MVSFLSVKVAALKPLYECSAADSDTCAVDCRKRYWLSEKLAGLSIVHPGYFGYLNRILPEKRHYLNVGRTPGDLNS